MATKKNITPLRYTLTLQFTPAERRRIEAAMRSMGTDVRTVTTNLLMSAVDAEEPSRQAKRWAARQELRDRHRGRGVDLVHSLARG
jgi:hypothetical protein